MSQAIEDKRNIAILGHIGTGKTTLAEAMLFQAKATTRLGSIEEGTTVSDYDDEEKSRKVSINTSILHCDWHGHRINILDTPGYADFVGEVLAALSAVECAVFTVGANVGVQVTTRKYWRLIEQNALPALAVVTKMNNENADFEAVLKQLKENFGDKFVPVVVPDIGGESFQRVCCITRAAGDVPENLKDLVQSHYEILVERAVEADDALMEKYLDEGAISTDELRSVLRKAIKDRILVPVVCSAGDREIGVRELLDFICEFLPSPADMPLPAASKPGQEETVPIAPDHDAVFTARVFKSVSDPYVGRMSYFRVYSGSVQSDSMVQCARTGKTHKVAHLFVTQGKSQDPVAEVGPGDIAAVAKMEDLSTSDTLCTAAHPAVLPLLQFPTPMVSLAVEPKSRGDEVKINDAFGKLAAQDPTFLVKRNDETHELVMSGMGNLHLEIMVSRMKQQFKVEVTTKTPRIPYKETITRKADAMYRHKKQSGGAGEFAEVWLRVEPMERGGGFEFANEVVGGAIPTQFIPSCEKGIRQVLHTGVIAGYQVIDVRVTVYDGKDHPVDSKDIAFQRAARQAFRKAVEDAKPVLLEPVMNIEINIPGSYMGEITGDLNVRRGRIMGMDSIGGDQVIKAQVPLAEISKYSTELRSMTGGAGSYTMAFSHYEAVPANVAEPVLAAYQKEHGS